MKVIKWNPLKPSYYRLLGRPSSKLVWIDEDSSPLVGNQGIRQLYAVMSARHRDQTQWLPPRASRTSPTSYPGHMLIQRVGSSGVSFIRALLWQQLPKLSPQPFQRYYHILILLQLFLCCLMAVALMVCHLKLLFLSFLILLPVCILGSIPISYPLCFTCAAKRGEKNYKLPTGSDSASTKHCIDGCNITKEEVIKKTRLIF